MKKINISLLLILFFYGVNLFAQYDTPLNEIALNDYLPTSASYPFSFVVLADTRDNSSNTSAIDPDFEVLMDQIAVLNPKFVINIGDIVNGGLEEQYQVYYNYISDWMSDNSIAFFTVPGNNEFKQPNSYEDHYPLYINAEDFFGIDSEYDFSFDLENVRIIAINNTQHFSSNPGTYLIDSDQLQFVADKLSEQNAPPLKFGFTHIPILHSTNLQLEGYTEYYNLLKNHYPKANFSGHKHYYQRYDDGCGFFDIITGGGGSNPNNVSTIPAIRHNIHHFLLVTVTADNNVEVETHFISTYTGSLDAQEYDFTLSTTGLTGTVALNNDTDCFGGNNGSATASGIGGTPPYNYSWDNGENTEIAIILNPGEHVCTITDDNGCEISVSVLIGDGPTGITDVVHYYTDGIIDSEEYYYANIVVHDDAVLTITSTAQVYFAEHSALIVKPGGELIVDGALLTSICGDALWLGISVEGNSNLSQTSTNQGKVTVKNGATIENAHTGVWLRANTEECTEILNSGGGIVYARNSTFKNCYVGIEFAPYRYSSGGNPVDNKSYAKGCHFLTTRILNGGFDVKAGIVLNEINKLKIKGCNFENTHATTNQHPIYVGTGILSYNSTFKVYSYCTGNMLPCNGVMVDNHFRNLEHGVRAYGWSLDNPFSITNSYFDKCAYGI